MARLKTSRLQDVVADIPRGDGAVLDNGVPEQGAGPASEPLATMSAIQTDPQRVELVPGYWVAWRRDFSNVACCARREDVLAAMAAEGLSMDDVTLVQLADEDEIEWHLSGHDFDLAVTNETR